MKIVTVETMGATRGSITLRSDSSILRNNDNFYLPRFSEDVVCSAGLLLRLTRLAKCVNARFAPRCYDSISVGVAFTARDVMQRAIANGCPCDEAYCFDHSFAVSPDCVPAEGLGAGCVSMSLGGRRVEGSLAQIDIMLDEALARASELMTLKTGDLVFVPLTEAAAVAEGDGVVVSLDGAEMLNFQIR